MIIKQRQTVTDTYTGDRIGYKTANRKLPTPILWQCDTQDTVRLSMYKGTLTNMDDSKQKNECT